MDAASYVQSTPVMFFFHTVHTCVVYYLILQTPNCDQLVCVECGQLDYLNTQDRISRGVYTVVAVHH